MHKKGVDVTVSEISEKVHSGEEIMIRKILTRFDPMVQLWALGRNLSVMKNYKLNVDYLQDDSYSHTLSSSGLTCWVMSGRQLQIRGRIHTLHQGLFMCLHTAQSLERITTSVHVEQIENRLCLLWNQSARVLVRPPGSTSCVLTHCGT